MEGEDGEEEGRCGSEEDWSAGSGVRRPMNAFFLFCKRHRSVVRERYPHLENRAITKILGEWWASLEAHEKHTYTELAKQYKEAFMKANPDFKWCKMPTLPTRSPVTRTKGATTKGDTLRWSPEQTNCPRPDMQRLPTLTKDPLSVSRQNNSSSPVLQQQQSSPDELPPTKPMTESGGNAAGEQTAAANPAPPNNPPPMSCKPPKKRYLENLENGTYGSGAAAGRLKSESSSSPSPTPSPVPCAPPQRAASTDQQTNNACSALLELAEGCQAVKKPPTAGGRQKAGGDWNAKSQENSGGNAPSSTTSATTTTTSTLTSSSNGSSGHCGGSVPPAGFGPIPMFDVSAANRIIDQAFSQPTTTASSTSVTPPPPPFAPLSTSSATTPPPGSGCGGGGGGSSSSSKSSRDRFFNVTSALSLAQSLSRSDDEQPLNLSKERPMTTIKASQQDIINHIIDKFLCGPSNVEPLDGTVFSAHGSARHPDDSPAVPAVVAAAIPGTQPAPNTGYYRADGDDDAADEAHRKVAGGSKGGAGVRRKGAAGSSPSKRARVNVASAGDEDGGSSPERARKSQRSCKGQRYQAMLSEGMLAGSKDRKGVVRKSDDEGDDEPSRLGGGGPGGAVRREDGAKVPRKNSGSFNLDAQIAALPKCSMESFTRRKSKKKVAGRPEDEARDDRFSPVDPADLGGPRDPSDLRPPGAHRGSSMRQRCDSGASGTDEATVDDPSSPPVPSPGDHSSLTPRKFKTGDFDLDEHLAALPKCDIEVLSRRKKELRRDSGSSSGKQDSKADESGTESDHAGASESTEENGVREEWPSCDEEEESEEAGPTSPKKDKRKRRKGGLVEEDFPSSLATLADIALSQKEKMQD